MISCALATMIAMQGGGLVFAGENSTKDLDIKLECQNQNKLFEEAIEHEASKIKFGTQIEKETFKNQVRSLFCDSKTKNTISIPNNVVAAGINVAISLVVGGIGVGSVQAYIESVGKEAARRIFYKTIVDRLMAWGAGYIATGIGVCVDFIMELTDFGGRIAEWLDSTDSCPNNGYWEVWE